MSALLLITSHFPFGTGEPFLENEFPFLYEGFDKIVIISRNTSSPLTRIIPDDVIVKRFSNKTPLTGFLKLPGLILKNRELIIHSFSSEVEFMQNYGRPLRIAGKMHLLKKIIKACELREFIEKTTNRFLAGNDIVYYSYWLNCGAHALALSNNTGCIKVSRAHGFDLYEERSKTGYLPLMKLCAEKLDAIFFISENGKGYFIQRTEEAGALLEISRLGVRARTEEIPGSDPLKEFLIVSCSSLTPLKRVDRIIDALGELESEKRIRWIHFGDGPLMLQLKEKAASILTKEKNIAYEFPGYVSNEHLMSFYSSKHIDLFLNTSIHEGVPVSIMEAQSFGIPVIATDVGGVSEIVVPGTGFLLPCDFMNKEFVSRIEEIIRLDSDEAERMSNKIKDFNLSNFNAEKNYTAFIKRVKSIFELKKSKEWKR